MKELTNGPDHGASQALRSIGTRARFLEFWDLAQSPQAVFEYGCLLLQQTANVAGVDFEHARVLDVACGDRQIAVPHLWQGARFRAGLDLDPRSLKANSVLDGRVSGDIHALPFADRSFDIVVSTDTVEHSDEPASFLHEVSRVLRPGGRALVFTPHLWGYKTMIARVGGPRLFDLVWKLFYGRTLDYDAFYRANTVPAMRQAASIAGLRVRDALYIAEIPHFFHRSRWLSVAAYVYNDVAMRLRAPWLLGYMMAVLEKP